jgi:Cyclic nucleotide-binding domain
VPRKATRVSRWAVCRLALSNPNIAKVEASIAVGVIASVAWSSTILVVTFNQLGPIGPGLYLLVRQFTGAMGAPIYAALAGRFRRERVLAAATVARGVAVALTVLVLELHTANALLFVAIALEGFTQSAPKALHDALLPWLADSPAQLVATNSLAALLDTTAVLVGAGLAVLVLWLSGPPGVLSIVALLYVLGAMPLLVIRGIDTRVGNDGSRILSDLAGGIGVLRRSPSARVLFVVMAATAALGGVESSSVTSIATSILHLGVNATPLLVGAAGVGGLIGGIASLSLGARRLMSVPLAVGLLGCAVTTFMVTVTSSELLVLTLTLLTGFNIGIAYQFVCSRTLLQRCASGRSLDLLVGINTVIGVAVVGVSGLCAGELTAAIGVRGTLRVAAGLAVLGAVYALWRLIPTERRSPVNREGLDAIEKVEAFGPLSVAATAQLVSALIPLQAADHEVIFRQGDPAEDMFLIGSGDFEVIIDGDRVRTLHSGDHFGEIALLFNSPRTGTIRCLQAGRLWRLKRDDFLRAVTGNSTTDEAMRLIAEQRLAHAGNVTPQKSDDGH